jgi:hypothetical protein
VSFPINAAENSAEQSRHVARHILREPDDDETRTMSVGAGGNGLRGMQRRGNDPLRDHHVIGRRRRENEIPGITGELFADPFRKLCQLSSTDEVWPSLEYAERKALQEEPLEEHSSTRCCGVPFARHTLK